MVALTQNYSEETFARTRELYPEVFAPFIDTIVSRPPRRVTKPDPRIYAILLARIAPWRPLTEVLFVDDNPGMSLPRMRGGWTVVFTTAETRAPISSPRSRPPAP
ncbi:MAG: hypothetical protein IPH03_11595 [Tetrasphaera sp.]|nr:hypothetical protein [Tetrasphaera sp.]